MSSNKIIIDTGFFIALFSKTDQYHKKAIKLRPIIDQRVWITTWPVITEVCHLLNSRGASHLIAPLFQMYACGGFEFFSLSTAHIPKMISMLEKYKSLPMDLADASLVLLAEELGHGDIVSTDMRDFSTYRWKNHKPFNNLFLSSPLAFGGSMLPLVRA